jgi:hypothetical protein
MLSENSKVACCWALAMFFSLAAGPDTAAMRTLSDQRSCERYHAKEYNGRKQAQMANVVRNPRERPDASIGDFTHADPWRTLDLNQEA